MTEEIYQCPVCGETQTSEFFVSKETLETLGCDACMRILTPEEAEPWVKDDWLWCPVCGEKCDDLYFDKYGGKVLGCDRCCHHITDPFEWATYYRN